MKKSRIYILVLALFMSLQMNGQALKSSYFLDNATTRHTLNPALAPLQGYVGMPFLSSLGVNIKGDIGASNLLFPISDGGVGTFLHPDVSSNQFLNGLDDITSLDFNFNYDILSMGWNTGNSSFLTLDIGLRFNVNSAIPKEFFSLLKNGMTSNSTNYNINNFALSQDAYTQVGIGYSQDIEQVDGLRVGGKVKMLLGINKAEVSVNSLGLNMSPEKWTISTDGYAKILGKGVDFVKDEDGTVTSMKINPSEIGIGGFGVAFDLGVEYAFPEGSLLSGLAFSASVTDLGLISYSSSNSRFAEVDNQSFDFKGLEGLDVMDFEISDEFNSIQKEIFSLVSLKEADLKNNMVQMLAANVHIGVEYSFLEEMMSLGLLYSGNYGPLVDINELTVAYNFTPYDWLGVVLSYSFLNTHKSIGWLLNLTPRRGINFFVGSDYTILSYTPQWIPVDKTFANVQLGLSFPIGANNIRERSN